MKSSLGVRDAAADSDLPFSGPMAYNTSPVASPSVM
jgi:hypothetical protein